MWAVCDMDEGILRWEPTRKAAVEWLKGLACTDRVLSRHQYGKGDYEYTVGADAEDSRTAWVVRADKLGKGGWDEKATALYPYADDPWQAGEP